NWINVSDGYFETGSIGAIRVASSDPNIVYVGTGSDGIRSNVITGKGMYKSEDAGKTWKFTGLRNAGQIGAVEINPNNPDIVFVAAIGNVFGPNPERGVYRTIDGGESWEKVLFLSDKTGSVDLELSPDNPEEIYAAMWHCERKPWTIISGAEEGGLFKSSDGGATWTYLTTGLPQDLIGKSDLAVSAADPNRVYLLMEASPGGGLYRSDNRGASFELVSTKEELLNRPFYYTNLDADPKNADILYVNTNRFFKSMDAGKTWKRLTTPHGDNHDMWINSQNPDIFIQSNDGGANVTLNGGKTWSTQYNQPTAELYQVDIDDQFPYWVYAGQQDNSTIAVPSLPPYPSPSGPTGHWISIGGCETGPAVPKPGNHNIVYANCKGRFGRYNKRTGQEKQFYVGAWNIYSHNPRDLKYRFQRVSPIHVSPHDPDVVYHASQYLHRTTDEGATWDTISPDLTENDPSKQVISGVPITRDITGEEFYSTIYAVKESSLEKGLIWVGANDGPIHVTRDGGKNWTNVTPEDLSPGGRVETVEPSPHRAGKGYIAVYRYLLNDWEPYIFRTENYGQTWTRLTTGSNGIPNNFPTRVVREDPDREGLLYAGTEFGMFVSFDDGANWQSLQLNLPVTPVTDIKVYRKDLVLSTMGRSFWILDNLTPLHILRKETAETKNRLYPPKDTYRMHIRSRSRSDSNTVPEYLSPGAMVDYFIG
ncbi:WD40/YVTN/BNR-like repeat-containing protein, partial [Acidobacteriota bacterium]